MANNKPQKRLNTLDILVVAFGAMIGWGWVVSSGQWILSGGVVGTAIGFVAGGFMIYFVGLCYAELTTAIPKSGGVLVFSYNAFGAVGAFICTWSIILSYIGVVCYEAVSFPTILQYLFPDLLVGYMYSVNGFEVYISWIVVAELLAITILVLNLLGAKTAARFQKILTFAIAFVGIMLVVASAFSGNVHNIESQAFIENLDGNVFQNIVRVAIMTPFFFFGFDVIPQAAEEINVPLKKIGRMMMLSITLAVLFYVLVVLSVGYIFNVNEIQTSMETTGLVTADAMAKAFSSKNMAKILIIGGMCGIVTSWNSFLLGGSRAISSMASAKMLPEFLSKNGKKFHTPIYALLLIGILSMIAPFFGKSMLIWIVDAGNFACCLAYCIVSISFLILRKKKPELNRPYKVKYYRIVGSAAILMSGIMVGMYIIPGTNCTLVWQEWVIVGIWGILGLAFGIWSKWKYKKHFSSDLKV